MLLCYALNDYYQKNDNIENFMMYKYPKGTSYDEEVQSVQESD
jgi:hypothetical protein